MKLFLTSSPTGDLDGRYISEGFDNRNGFAHRVREYWRDNSRVLMISAFPDDEIANREMGAFFYNAIRQTGLSVSEFDLWDASVMEDPNNYSRDRVQAYDVIILGGGHVPTQQRFFEQLNLGENISGFDGIVIGISAGTMNCAEIVYAQPEEPGEAIDQSYRRFIRGLGLTNTNILPHYQLVRDKYLDGMHLFDEISIPDSIGHKFIALIDGSYVFEYEGHSTVYGEAYVLEDGDMYRICDYCCSTKFI